jgi:hypothetical protein
MEPTTREMVRAGALTLILLLLVLLLVIAGRPA